MRICTTICTSRWYLLRNCWRMRSQELHSRATGGDAAASELLDFPFLPPFQVKNQFHFRAFLWDQFLSSWAPEVQESVARQNLVWAAPRGVVGLEYSSHCFLLFPVSDPRVVRALKTQRRGESCEVRRNSAHRYLLTRETLCLTLLQILQISLSNCFASNDPPQIPHHNPVY